jgi:signal transduction histidine kinase
VNLAQAEGRKSVLVIDDNEEIRNQISRALTRSGYQVRSAVGATDAFDQLERDSAPDVILLDLKMPGMSGWEFRVEQRQRPHIASIPVVAMSADSSAQAKAINADAYLPKPFEPQSLVDAIDRVVLASDRSKLRAQRAEAERLRTLGVLSAGIAHEVNNPLTVVLGCAELSTLALHALSEHVAPGGAAILCSLHKHVADIEHGAERIAGVVHGIATLGRQDDASVADIDVHEALYTSMRLVANEIRLRARLVRTLHPVPMVRGSFSKLLQVLLNVLTNAVHAIPEGAAENNEVRVETSTSSEGNVVIDISDTGTGMTPEVMARMFEPFFTTKPIGSGMGLGLSISHRLLAELGGTLTARSRQGEGSTFRIELPAARTTNDSRDEGRTPPRSPRAVPRSRLLVVDDEPQMCELIAGMLKGHYEVISRTSAREALALLDRGERFDALLCDLMMPDVTGMDLQAELLRTRPELAAHTLFMTGGSFTQRASSFIAGLARRPLAKPFSMAELIARLDELFAQREAGAVHA